MSTLARHTLSLAVVVAAIVLPGIAAAQCPPPPSTSLLAEGEVGLFFDPSGTMTCGDIFPGINQLYVVARVPEGGVAAYDGPEVLSDNLPSGMLIVGATVAVNSGYEGLLVLDGCGRARRLDPESCPVAQGDLIVLSIVELFASFPVVGSACFQTACPTIAGTVAMDPTYNRCDTGAMGAFTDGGAMCLGFGQAPTPVEASSWGAIKALYRN